MSLQSFKIKIEDYKAKQVVYNYFYFKAQLKSTS